MSYIHIYVNYIHGMDMSRHEEPSQWRKPWILLSKRKEHLLQVLKTFVKTTRGWGKEKGRLVI